ncbi:unnamed protein product [Bursaphelenchus okinawaensis]|uniref:Uncharacterized protein n=1 Tax=Bursaphelenchus okinawaensis TaxID=465554 RepID=A0A811JQB6_9BILA|nr:unnamed protein product [Bursaphelenchus okinawaensis]CAG9077539.1 unnamed protein product [Bursaphelenchus okinawaensis]
MASTKNSKKNVLPTDQVQRLQRELAEKNEEIKEMKQKMTELEGQVEYLAEEKFRLRLQLTKVRLVARHTIDSPDEKVPIARSAVRPPAQSSTAVMDNTGINNGIIHIEQGRHIKIGHDTGKRCMVSKKRKEQVPVSKRFPRNAGYIIEYDLEEVKQRMPPRKFQSKSDRKKARQIWYLIKKNKERKPLTAYDVYLVEGYSQLSTWFQPVDGPTFYSLYDISRSPTTQ